MTRLLLLLMMIRDLHRSVVSDETVAAAALTAS